MERRVLCACANGQMIANRTRGPTIMNQTHVRAIDRGCLLANIIIRPISCQYWTSYIGQGVGAFLQETTRRIRYTGQRRSINSLHPKVETTSCGVAISVSYFVIQRLLWDIRKQWFHKNSLKTTCRNRIVSFNSISTTIQSRV